MYLLKQWREGRVLLAVAAVGLLLLLSLLSKIAASADRVHAVGGDIGGFLIGLFGVQTFAIGAWAWALGSIGAGKNIGEVSGAYLFTRPRRRAWFVWYDWGFATAAVAATIVLLDLIVGLFCLRMMHLAHLSPARIPIAGGGVSSLAGIMGLEALGVLALAGLLYGLSYLCTIIVRRSSGVILSAGLLLGYSLMSGVLGHYYRVALPSFTPPLLWMHAGELGIAPHVAAGIAVRMVLALILAVTAQVALNRTQL